RFNCTLRTVTPAEVDYIVKVSAPVQSYPVQADSMPNVATQPLPTVKTRAIKRRGSWHGIILKPLSMSQVKGTEGSREAMVLEFELSSLKQNYAFSAGSLGVKQSGHFVPIESVYLDSVDLK